MVTIEITEKERRKGGSGGGGGDLLGTGQKIGQFAICTSSIIDFVCPQNFAHPFLISPGYCSRPREIEDNTYAIFFGGGRGGDKLVYYGR